jgi:ATP-binding cassette subfamily C protein
MRKNNTSSFERLLLSLVKAMPWRVAFAITLMITVGLTEGIGLLLLLPLMQLVGLDLGQGSAGRLTQLAISALSTIGVTPTLVGVLAVYVLVTAVQALFARWQTVFNVRVVNDFVNRLRTQLYEDIARTSWSFFCRSRASDFTHVLTSEIDRISIATHFLLALIADTAVSTVYIALALRLSPTMTLIVFASGGALILLLKGRTEVARRKGEELSTATNDLYAAAIEHLNGIKTVKAYGAEDRNLDFFSKLTERVGGVYIAAARNQANVTLGFKIGSVLILSMILYIALGVLTIPIAAVLLLLFLFGRIMPRLSGLHEHYQFLVNALPAFAAFTEMQERCKRASEPITTRRENFELCEGVEFDRVSFGYQSRVSVISELDLFIQAGRTTAIVGPSGVGKSTIADLTIGLISPDRGRLLIDGVPLNPERMKSWREQIGYVAQDTFLFHDSIRANLLWACPDASDEEMWRALRLAAAEGFVSELQEGLETIVGDRGVRLSVGERQRLALARALLRKPSMLILDEATSALDSKNERRIQNAINELHGNMTIVIITHRLSTIRESDIIYVIEKGKVMESGNWDQLLARDDGHFQALYRAQRIDANREFEEMVNKV